MISSASLSTFRTDLFMQPEYNDPPFLLGHSHVCLPSLECITCKHTLPFCSFLVHLSSQALLPLFDGHLIPVSTHTVSVSKKGLLAPSFFKANYQTPVPLLDGHIMSVSRSSKFRQSIILGLRTQSASKNTCHICTRLLVPASSMIHYGFRYCSVVVMSSLLLHTQSASWAHTSCSSILFTVDIPLCPSHYMLSCQHTHTVSVSKTEYEKEAVSGDKQKIFLSA